MKLLDLFEEDTNEIKELIERDCAFFLKESGMRGLLGRGVMNISDSSGGEVIFATPAGTAGELPYWKKSVRKDRRPKDMDLKFHKGIDDWFQKEVGFRARSEAMFCFGQDARKSVLSQYGTPCVVFPIGEFKYVWSAKVPDLYSMLQGADDLDDAIDYLGRAVYIDEHLDVAVMLSKEIMIKCDNYYAFKLTDERAIRYALGIDIFRG